MTEREALKLALEALVEAADAIDSWGSYASGYFQVKHDLENDISKAKSAITTIKEALSSCQCPECKVLLHASDCAVHNEPAYPKGECNCGAQPEHGWTPERIAGMSRLKEAQDKKLAHPEPEYLAFMDTPQRKPLTDEEIINEADRFDWGKDCAVRFARAIEAAHGIKGEA